MTAVTEIDRAAVVASVEQVLGGGRPGEDDRFRAAADDAEAALVRDLAAEAAARLEGRPADRILAWAAAVVPRFALTSSFGAESAVLLHMASRVAPDVPVLFLDTGFHFAETIDYRRRLARELDLTVVDIRPGLSVAQQAARHGPELYRADPGACCRLRKVEPLQRALGNYDGWASGVRRAQTPERAGTAVVEARPHGDRWLVRVAPLAAWSDGDVEAYRAAHDLPEHPLAGDGYRSIGCAPCTVPVTDDEDPRAGRWPLTGRTECGIHLPAAGLSAADPPAAGGAPGEPGSLAAGDGTPGEPGSAR